MLLGALGLGVSLEPPAAAQEAYLQTRVPPPTHAFELQVSGGYTQGFGNIIPDRAILDAAGAGLGLTASLGYRASARASIEVEGQYQAFASENAGTSQGLDLNVGTTLHFLPTRRGDPWVRLGTGFRWLWVNDATPGPIGYGALGGNVGFSGFDLLNVRVGYDIQAWNGVSWAPILGANLQTFVWANSTPLAQVQWGTFLYAGLQARFDAGGREDQPRAGEASRPIPEPPPLNGAPFPHGGIQ